MITVACVKSRPLYSHSYVNRLYRAVRANLSVPHRFICLTDDSAGQACPSKMLPKGLEGWWAKLALFRYGALEPPVIYFDLDTVIVDSIDFMAEFKGDFAILRDFYRPEGMGSGVMLWNKPQPHVWDNWLAAGRPNHPLGDQGWMEQQVPKAEKIQDLWPGKVKSFKADDLQDGPKGAAVVAFHGQPKPHDFPGGHWVERAWKRELQQVA